MATGELAFDAGAVEGAMSRLHCARYTIPTHRPWWERAWRAWQVWCLHHELACLREERDTYLHASSNPESGIKLGPEYLADRAQHEQWLLSRIAVLEIHS